MFIQIDRPILYWNHFLSIETDLWETSRYVEFNVENSQTFSTEFTKIILSACAEVDVVLKKIAKMYGLNKNHSNFGDYLEIIRSEVPTLITEDVIIEKYNLDVSPFRDWNSDSELCWHKSYNNLKHNRGDYYKEGNLDNALTSVGALFTVVIHYYLSRVKTKKDASEKAKNCKFQHVVQSLQEKSKLFKFTNQY